MPKIILVLLIAPAVFAGFSSVALGEDRSLVNKGAPLYAEHCATCHSLSLRGSAHGNTLKGAAFLDRWAGQDAKALLLWNSLNMPPGGSSELDPAAYAAITAYLIDQNNSPETEQAPLFRSLSELHNAADNAVDSEWENWSGAGTIEQVAQGRGSFVNREVTTFTSVTDRMLQSPPDADWLSWRRTLDGQGYSPLKQISRANVDKLQLAWAVTMKAGSNQVTPLVHDGIMYLTHPGNIIQALDAATGELIWEYSYRFPEASKTLGGPTRNIAIYKEKLYLATYDAVIVAIDARTGRQLWRTPKADYQLGYTHTAGPVIGDGVVLSGINGCEWYKPDGCFITGHDADTGEELWRTSTIALPGEPGGESWHDLPADMRAGGDNWIAGSYDPGLKLFFVGTSQAKPWVAASRGM
ncbi:MAG: PQQ-binding-like beta-propeller repeat protein, partial [Shewanella algae]